MNNIRRGFYLLLLAASLTQPVSGQRPSGPTLSQSNVSAVSKRKAPNDYASVQWILLFVQVGGLLALLAYVYKTWDIAKASQSAAEASNKALDEMRKAREQNSEPRVVIFFATAMSSFAEIVIENFGEGTAADVLCTFDPPLQTTGQGDASAFFHTPKWMPPRSRLSHAFDGWTQYLASDLPRRYTVNVRYKDITRARSFEFDYILDVTAFEHLIYWERKDLHDVARSLDNIEKILDRRLTQLDEHHERDVKIANATPAVGDARPAVAAMIAAWRLHNELVATPNAYAFTGHFLPGIRKHAATALGSAIVEKATPEQEESLRRVFAAAHNHDFDVMTDQNPAREALGQAIVHVEAVWMPLSQ